MPGYHPKERIQLSEHGENLKSKNIKLYDDACFMSFYPVAAFTSVPSEGKRNELAVLRKDGGRKTKA
jgi:hypothetical protein